MAGTLRQVRRLKQLLLSQIRCESTTTYEQYDILRRLLNSINPSHPIFVEDKFDEVIGYLTVIRDNSDIWRKLAKLSESSQTNISINLSSKPRKNRKKAVRKPYSKQSPDSNTPFRSYGRDLPADFGQYYQEFSLEVNKDHRNTHALQMSSGTRTRTSITEAEELSIPGTASTISNNWDSSTITGFSISKSPRNMSTHTPDRGSTTSSNGTITGLSINGTSSSILAEYMPIIASTISNYCESRSMSFSNGESVPSNILSPDDLYLRFLDSTQHG
ncbi:4022_t:CDS:2 [Paraglomus brasilianum]|uniref:4022_t:CDS:1 n=1 Tax=Paraglomus brasilianum TaxID=144538 RepID=A0A9N9GAQ2_9GLOM|nr:4022_t:CDS:2 [Paraglomus brasilianum]